MANNKKLQELDGMNGVPLVDADIVHGVTQTGGQPTDKKITVKELSDHAETHVKANAAHASEQEDTDQAKLASVGKVQEMIGEGRRVVPVTSTPTTLDQTVIYLVHDSDEDITFGAETVHAGTTARVYYDGNGWVAVEDSSGKSIKRQRLLNYFRHYHDFRSTSGEPSVHVTTGDNYVHFEYILNKGDKLTIRANQRNNVLYFLADKDTLLNPGDVVESAYTFNGNPVELVEVESGNVAEIIADIDCKIFVQGGYVGKGNSMSSEHEFIRCMPDEISVDRASGSYDTYVEEKKYKVHGGSINSDNGVISYTATSNNRITIYKINQDIASDYRVNIRKVSSVSSGIVFYTLQNGDFVKVGTEITLNSEDEWIMKSIDIPTQAEYMALYYHKNDWASLMKPVNDVSGMAECPTSEPIFFMSRCRRSFIPNQQSSDVSDISQTKLDTYVENEPQSGWTRGDWCPWAIMLPSTYKEHGRKTPIIVHCHGTGGYVTPYSFGTESGQYVSSDINHNKEVARRANERGYAFLVINGYGMSWQSDMYSDYWVSPLAVECTYKVFHFCLDVFNVQDKMVMSGMSMGGCMATAYAMSHANDVACIAILVPANGFLSTILSTSTGDSRANAAGYFSVEENGVTKSASQVAREDHWANLVGYVPFFPAQELKQVTIGSDTFDVVATREFTDYSGTPTTEEQNAARNATLLWDLKVPFFAWNGDQDTNVPIASTEMMVNAIRRAGGIASLRVCPNVAHSTDVTKDGTTYYAITSIAYPYDELLDVADAYTRV